MITHITLYIFLVAVFLIRISAAPQIKRLPSINPSCYAPTYHQCPTQTEFVRMADGLGKDELQYITERREKKVHKNLKEFIIRQNIPGFNAEEFFEPKNGKRPDIGIGLGVSGGGFRAMLIGAGIMSAMDIRTPGSTRPGHLGGLLQSTSYVSGLSGGAWLIGSVFIHDMPTIGEISKTSDPWNLQFNLLTGDTGVESPFNKEFQANVLLGLTTLSANGSDVPLVHEIQDMDLLKNINSTLNLHTTSRKNFIAPIERVKAHYNEIYEELKPKKAAGFEISITDFWARALAKSFLGTKINPGTTWSDLTHAPHFRSRDMPFPILTANAIVPKNIPHASTSTIIEMTPFEFGSWGPTLNAFTPTKYLGTKLFDGKVIPRDDGKNSCVNGFDNIAFILASSSSLFNDLAAMGMKHLDGFPQIRSVLTKYKTFINVMRLEGKTNLKNNFDYALFSPNPFKGFHRGVKLPTPAEAERGLPVENLIHIDKKGNYFTNYDTLHIVDGGEDDLNIPVDPLLRPERKLDFVIAADVSIDKNSKPNGTSVYRGTWRYHDKEDIHKISYPYIFDPDKFIKEGANTSPGFFGCDLDNSYPNPELYGGSSPDSAFTPDQLKSMLPKPALMLYVPNSDMNFKAQQPTTRVVYSPDEVQLMIRNGYSVMTNGNSTLWTGCVSCGIMHREFIRQGREFPDFCKMCFNKFCYN